MEAGCRSCVRLLSNCRTITKIIPVVSVVPSTLRGRFLWHGRDWHRSLATKCLTVSPLRNLHTDTARNVDADESFFKRILRKFGKLEYSNSKLRYGGFLLYEKCSDDVDYNTFMHILNLPDTYYSWFLITELHVWMCMVRVMSEGPEGKVVRNEMIKSLWKDAAKRAQKIGGLSGSERKDEMISLNEQFMATLFLYDEGLLSNDKILAAALWRRLFMRSCDDAHALETIVHYVRKQTVRLEKCSREDVLLKGKISWTPLSELS